MGEVRAGQQRQTEATERKGPSPRTEEKGAEVGRTGTGRDMRGLSREERRERERKQICKTRHFPSYKIRCRLALRGAGVTLSIWARGTWQMGGDATEVSGIQSLLALGPAQPESGPGLSLSDKALETLSECVIKGWVTE